MTTKTFQNFIQKYKKLSEEKKRNSYLMIDQYSLAKDSLFVSFDGEIQQENQIIIQEQDPDYVKGLLNYDRFQESDSESVDDDDVSTDEEEDDYTIPCMERFRDDTPALWGDLSMLVKRKVKDSDDEEPKYQTLPQIYPEYQVGSSSRDDEQYYNNFSFSDSFIPMRDEKEYNEWNQIEEPLYSSPIKQEIPIIMPQIPSIDAILDNFLSLHGRLDDIVDVNLFQAKKNDQMSESLMESLTEEEKTLLRYYRD